MPQTKAVGQLGTHGQAPQTLDSWPGLLSHFPKSTVTGSSWSSEVRRGTYECLVFSSDFMFKKEEYLRTSFIFINKNPEKKNPFLHFENWISLKRRRRSRRGGGGRKKRHHSEADPSWTTRGSLDLRFPGLTWKQVRTEVSQPHPPPPHHLLASAF